MKKITVLFLSCVMCLSLCGCGGYFRALKEAADAALENAQTAAAHEAEQSKAPAHAPKPDAGIPANAEQDSAPADVSAEAAVRDGYTQAELEAIAEARRELYLQSLYEKWAAAQAAPKNVRVTKSPTSELVYEGGCACFIACAENSTGMTWLFVSPDGSRILDAYTLAANLPGLSISGAGTSTLTVGCIPQSLNGWKVQAKFYGEGGPVHSAMAQISVWQLPAANPSSFCEPRGGGAPYRSPFVPYCPEPAWLR